MIAPAALVTLMRRHRAHAVLDLRERARYERGHIFRTTSLPRRLLEWRVRRLVPAHSTPVVLCDDDGRLAALARPTVEAMGYRDVRVLKGGLEAWRRAGLPLVQGVNVPSKVFGERMLHERKTPQVSPQELRAWLVARADLVLVDARTPEEYQRGCIPGAWSMPGGELVLRIAELVTGPDTGIVVHCGGRTRSYIGAESLRRMGLPNRVLALENGTMGWELAGLALERGAARWAPAPSAESRARAATVAARVAQEDAVTFVSAADVRSLWEARHHDSVYILDVRSPDEYAVGHLPGSVSAPGGQAVQATDEYVAVTAASIVLVCDDTVRSVMTASWLGHMGFPRVSVLRGGIGAWVDGGGALDVGMAPDVPFGLDEARREARPVAATALAAALDGEDRPLVLDVAPSDAYRRGHVPGAVWACRSRLELTLAHVAPDRSRPIVVTCGDGQHSTLAAATLDGLGYARVSVLDGGIRAWAEAGLGLEPGLARLADEPDDVLLKPYDRGRAAMHAYLRWEEALDAEGQSPHALIGPGGDRS
jgi:rhodanese-related sulfurtransferase